MPTDSESPRPPSQAPNQAGALTGSDSSDASSSSCTASASSARPRALIAGYGLIGKAAAPAFVDAGYDVWALRRTAVEASGGVNFVAADLCDKDALDATVPDNVELVLFSAAPGVFNEAAYQAVYRTGLNNLLRALEEKGGTCKRFIFVSSTAVYGQRDGEAVDEDSETAPTMFNGKAVLEAERTVLGADVGGIVIRSGGIHCEAEGRHPLLVRVQKGISGSGVRANLIHRTDLVRAVLHLATLPVAVDEEFNSVLAGLRKDQRVFIAVQDEVPEDWTIQDFVADTLNLPRCPRVPPPPERMRPSRRASNKRLKVTGFELTFPTYRESYTDLVRKLGLLPELEGVGKRN